MIGYLEGKVISKLPGQIIIKTAGVGYLVNIPSSTNIKLNLNDPAEVFIHTHIREDAFDLYGFSNIEELDLFKLVMTVSGIGPKTALLVVDRGSENVEKAIKEANLDFFTGIPRLGRKNAQKIIIELKNKLGGSKELDLQENTQEFEEIVDALKSMGYSKNEAVKVVKELPKDISLEQKITQALKLLGQSHG